MKLSQQRAAVAMDPNHRPGCISEAADGKLHLKVCSSPDLNWNRRSAEVHCSLFFFLWFSEFFWKYFSEYSLYYYYLLTGLDYSPSCLTSWSNLQCFRFCVYFQYEEASQFTKLDMSWKIGSLQYTQVPIAPAQSSYKSVRPDCNVGLDFYLEIQGRKWTDSEFKAEKVTVLF